MRAKLTIEEMQKRARSRGGKCLSKRYVNAHHKLKWKCKNGHVWSAKSYIIKNGSWCPECHRKLAGSLVKLTIQQMKHMAKSRGGTCISKTYTDTHSNLIWCCKKGHKWKAMPRNVKNGTWCPYCSRRIRLTIQEMRSIASKRGGKCLSKKYMNIKTNLKWQCRYGHKWIATAANVKKSTWCPYCARNKK